MGEEETIPDTESRIWRGWLDINNRIHVPKTVRDVHDLKFKDEVVVKLIDSSRPQPKSKKEDKHIETEEKYREWKEQEKSKEMIKPKGDEELETPEGEFDLEEDI